MSHNINTDDIFLPKPSLASAKIQERRENCPWGGGVICYLPLHLQSPEGLHRAAFCASAQYPWPQMKRVIRSQRGRKRTESIGGQEGKNEQANREVTAGDSPFNKWCWNSWTPLVKNTHTYTHTHTHTKPSKQIMDLHVKLKFQNQGDPWQSSGQDSVLLLPWSRFNPWLGN